MTEAPDFSIRSKYLNSFHSKQKHSVKLTCDSKRSSSGIRLPILICSIVSIGLISLAGSMYAFFSDVISGNLNAMTSSTAVSWDFGCTNSIELWTAPYSGEYQIEAWGAQGGMVSNYNGYEGAYAVNKITLTQGDVLKILPGCKGGFGAGGGGSFVTTNVNSPLVIAGGGGGRGGLTNSGTASQQTSGSPNNYGQAGQNGGSTVQNGGGTGGNGGDSGITNGPGPGGGGLLSKGVDGTSNSGGGQAFINGGVGGLGAGTALGSPNQPPGKGGFGGGGGGYNNNSSGYFRGGGGGGYSGGQGGSYSPDAVSNSGGGGGGSYAIGPDANTIAGNSIMPAPGGSTQTGQSGDGFIHIEYKTLIQVVEEFQCTNSMQQWTVPFTDVYQIETWGAQGGSGGYYSYSSAFSTGGMGGYATGKVQLTAGTDLYIYVGCEGAGWNPRNQQIANSAFKAGGFGGGGNATNTTYAATGGGGASDVRIGTDSLNHRVIVAGGGGGGGNSNNSTQLSDGGPGGGAVATTLATSTQFTNRNPGGGGTQSAGGISDASKPAGTFGAGANQTENLAGGGGGGWYGGGVGANSTGGGGGSGYVLTSSSYKPPSYALGNAYYMTDTSLLGGDVSMPDTTGGTQTGQAGNGFVRITSTTGSSAVLPTITLLGSDPLTIPQYSVFSNVDPGATASDIVDGDITSSIIVLLNGLDENTPGTYTVIYSVTNSSNVTVTVTRTVIVKAPTFDFTCTNSPQLWTVPNSGLYQLETWGAQGGSYSTSYEGGHGGYSIGTAKLTAGQQLYVYVGCEGGGGTASGGHSGGFGGGGSTTGSGSGGGGASDIRIDIDSLFARVIVAGGGGGSSYGSTTLAGYGGGLTGGATSRRGSATGGSQTTPGTTAPTSPSYNQWSPADFGLGGSITGGNVTGGGGGGGGWYGGAAGPNDYPSFNDNDDTAGAGGSGYVYTSATSVNVPVGWLLTSTDYLTNASVAAGNASIPDTSGSMQTGQPGDGFVRIVQLRLVPTITVLGNDPEVVVQGSVYSDAGATANDLADGDLTSSINVSMGGLNTSIPGTYVITYSVTNSAGLTTTATRTVQVLSAQANFNCINAVQTWQAPITGQYKLETWGANGGVVSLSNANGKGGYSSGIASLTSGETLYIYVGCKGEESITGNYVNKGGFNGGGDAKNTPTTAAGSARTGGGGASDIRVVNDTLFNRIIVAGGGGGNSGHASNQVAGNGGGLTGVNGSFGGGGTQTAGGNNQVAIGSCASGFVAADFGQGSACTGSTVGGGGGGWYGGGNGNGGGGGSGYVLTSGSIKPLGYFVQYASYYLTNTVTSSMGQIGFVSNPEINGNGFVRITQVIP